MAPLRQPRPASAIGHPARGRISLAVNGETRQDGDLGQMIWPVPDIVAKLSQLFELAPATSSSPAPPPASPPLGPGDRVSAGIEAIGELEIAIGER